MATAMATPRSGIGRVVEHRWLQYRRTYRASIFSSFLTPVLFLAAMGLGLGSYVDEGTADASLGGVSFQAAWAKRLEARYQKTRFGAFMQRVFAGDASGDAHGDMLKVRRAMRWARAALWG